MWRKLMAFVRRLVCRQPDDFELPRLEAQVPPPPISPHARRQDRLELEWLRVHDRELRQRLQELELDVAILSRRRTAGSHE